MKKKVFSFTLDPEVVATADKNIERIVRGAPLTNPSKSRSLYVEMAVKLLNDHYKKGGRK